MKSLFLSAFMVIAFNTQASEQFEINSHYHVKRFVEAKLKEYRPEEVLVVFDIDNTVLAMNDNFGSDQWFQWQKEELSKGSEFSLAKDFSELLTIQNEIFSFKKMHVTENILLNLIPSFQNQRVKTIALTSRGPDMRKNTNKELFRNDISFNALPVGYSIRGSFKPTNGSRLASYQDGIFMTSGMHKGEMLKYLLGLFNESYKCIIFIDDHSKHTTRVYDTFNNGLDINTFRYGYEDRNVEDFKRSDKKRSIELGRAFLEIRNQN